MEIKIFDSASIASKYTADLMANVLKKQPKAVLGVATGRTMDAVYHHLTDLYKKEPFDCSEAKAFALDEYIGLDVDSEHSYRSYLNFHLFDPLKFSSNNIFLPDVHSDNFDLAGINYEEEISKAGGIDLQILGIGLNGHIGLNEPGSAHDSKTRVVALSQSTRESNKALFGGREVPLTAMTMGIGTILDAKRLVLLATGKSKSEIIQRLVNGDVASMLPASALKLHKNALLVLDNESASLL